MRRKRFIEAYLTLFKVVEIRYSEVTDDYISGTAIYDPFDLEETQDFVLRMREDSLPSSDVLDLITFLGRHKLIDIDRIKVPREILRLRFEKDFNRSLTPMAFDAIVDDLERIRIRMVDDGVETDAFFIHE